MSRYIPMFHFWMGQGRGIGPTQLKSLWAGACGSKDVSVTRQSHTVAGVQFHVYALAAPSSTANVDAIEVRLKQSLDAVARGARVSLTRLG
jgi:hypothetical protein